MALPSYIASDGEVIMCNTTQSLNLPVLPLRDVVVYPHMVIPLFVGRDKSVRALEKAMDGDRRIVLVAQTSPDIDEPEAKDLFSIGTLAQVLQLLKLPDGTIKVLVEGVARVEVSNCVESDAGIDCAAKEIESTLERDAREIGITVRSLMALFEQYIKMNRK